VNKIINDCDFLRDLLESLSEITLWTHLEPQNQSNLEQYTKATGKIFPSDYEYWVTKFGAGQIDFTFGTVDIQSPTEFISRERWGRSPSFTPKDSYNRVYIWDSCAPEPPSIDLTIPDLNGCCPVVIIGIDDLVLQVYASSFPMYLVYEIIELAKSALSKLEDEPCNDECTLKHLKRLSAMDMTLIDPDIILARSRAELHNTTSMSEKEYLEYAKKYHDLTEDTLLNTLDILGECTSIFECEDTDLYEQIQVIEKDISACYFNFEGMNGDFFTNASTDKDIKFLIKHLSHRSRFVRTEAWFILSEMKLDQSYSSEITAIETRDIFLANRLSSFKAN